MRPGLSAGLAALLALSAGLALSTALHAPLWVALPAAGLLAAPRASRLRAPAVATALLALGMILGGARLAEPVRGPLVARTVSRGEASTAWVRGTVVSAESAPEGSRVVLAVDSFREGDSWEPDGTSVRSYLPVEPPPEGSRLEASLLLSLPREATNPGQSDLRERLAQGGVALRGVCRDAALLKTLPEGRPGLFARYRAALRERLLTQAGERGGLLLAVLLGDRGRLDPEEQDDLVRSGLYHLVALSGTHIALLLLVLAGVAHLAGFHPAGRDGAGVAMAVLYGLLVGPVPSMGRAVLMGVLFLVARLLDRPQPGLWAWSLSLAALLLYDPRWALDAGFQLTYGATLGILLLAGACPGLPARASGATGAWKLLWMGVAAQLFTLPILVHDFHRLSLAGVLATPLAAVPLTLVLAVGLPYLAGGAFVPGVGEVLAWLLARGAELFLLLPRWLGRGGWGNLFLPEPWPGWYLLYAGALGLLLLPGRRRRAGWIAFAAVCLSAFLFPRPFDRAPGSAFVVLDVGQASAQAVVGEGGLVLVDCGDSAWRGPSSARTVVEPFVASLGLRQVGGVVLTHWDADHAGGVPDLLRDLPVGFIAYPAADPPGEGLPTRVVALCRKRGVALVPLGRGDRFASAGARWQILHPGRTTALPGENDRSLAAAVDVDGLRLLFTGDLEAAGERELLMGGEPLAAWAVMVPHHGSQTSSTPGLVAAVSPRLACVTVGAANRFGHPRAEVVARWSAAGARVVRTDRDGALLLVPGPQRPEVHLWRDGDWVDEVRSRAR